GSVFHIVGIDCLVQFKLLAPIFKPRRIIVRDSPLPMVRGLGWSQLEKLVEIRYRFIDVRQSEVNDPPILPGLRDSRVEPQHLIVIRQSFCWFAAFLVESSAEQVATRVFRLSLNRLANQFYCFIPVPAGKSLFGAAD